MIFRIIGWILRIIAIVCLGVGIYLAYQYFANDTAPEQAIQTLTTQTQQGIQEVTTTIEQTTQQTTNNTNTKNDGVPQVCYESTCYSVEIADTPRKRQMGLMHRETLVSDAGMLFVFNTPGSHKFWMKNTKLTLDMIWIDAQNEIVYIKNSAPPCEADPCPSYGPSDAHAKYVLELNGGQANDWKVGDRVWLPDMTK